MKMDNRFIIPLVMEIIGGGLAVIGFGFGINNWRPWSIITAIASIIIFVMGFALGLQFVK
jgi:hypothetical protein